MVARSTALLIWLPYLQILLQKKQEEVTDNEPLRAWELPPRMLIQWLTVVSACSMKTFQTFSKERVIEQWCNRILGYSSIVLTNIHWSEGKEVSSYIYILAVRDKVQGSPHFFLSLQLFWLLGGCSGSFYLTCLQTKKTVKHATQIGKEDGSAWWIFASYGLCFFKFYYDSATS